MGDVAGPTTKPRATRSVNGFARVAVGAGRRETRSRRRGSRSAGSVRQVDGQGPDGSMLSCRGWSLIGIMMAVRLVASPTCSLSSAPTRWRACAASAKKSFGPCRLHGRGFTARNNLTGRRPLLAEHAATPIDAIDAIGGMTELRRSGCSFKPLGIAPGKPSRGGAASPLFLPFPTSSVCRDGLWSIPRVGESEG